MRFDQLEYFYAIVSNKTIQSVSEKFYTSPQVVSKAIKQLEDELQVKLFSRTRHGLIITEEGKKLLPHAEEILFHYNEIKNIFTSKNANVQMKELKIASSKRTAYLFNKLINNLKVSLLHTNINLTFNVDSFYEINKFLYSKNDYDLIATFLPDDELENIENNSFIKRHYVTYKFFREKTKLWVNKKSPYATKDKVTMSDLHNIPLIQYNITNDSHFDNYLKKYYNLTLTYAYKFTDINMALDLVKNNIGAFFSPEQSIFKFSPATTYVDMIALDILGIDYYQTMIIFLDKKKEKDPIFATIMEIIEQELS